MLPGQSKPTQTPSSSSQGKSAASGQQSGYNYGYYPASYSYGDKADLLDKIKPEHIVHVYMHHLMGEKFENNVWTKDALLQSRSLSSIGAWEIANLMLSASSQNVTLSNLTDDEIRVRALEIARASIRICLRNWKIYKIRGRDHLEYIFQIVFGNTIVSLKQCQNEGIRALLKGTTSEVRTVNESNEKAGFISNLFRRNK